ncbi:copper chaperone PCu(A)C [Nisaea nitritireducens]|jgi:copper(I)-binding protein|uniref:copper chaperone PCu(A)C n=1 Tax=Nisaea nitritireducens TaxID=568392 RepID=UPI001869254A|nr:copper chaperone PCu(A)C [Nisaea nitritireducens]|tara:strand:- start:3615 stop:4079 length:465 start_codon:yes stop_codon:yes gene_type:complete
MRLDVIKGKPALRAGLAIFASLMFSEDFGDANADISKDVFDAISIEQLSVEPATQGASARVKFAIENESGQPLTLTGVSSGTASSGALRLRFPITGMSPVPELAILDRERLDLGTSHVEAVLLDVREPISHGDTVHLTLHFRSFSIPVVAHAHP